MDFKKPRPYAKREQAREKAIRRALQEQGWLVEKTHGNRFQAGFPDLFCYHPEHGMRWVEVKTPTGRLTHAQFVNFSKWESFGCGVWILIDATEINLLHEPPNWRRYEDRRQKPTKKWMVGYEGSNSDEDD